MRLRQGWGTGQIGSGRKNPRIRPELGLDAGIGCYDGGLGAEGGLAGHMGLFVGQGFDAGEFLSL